MTHGNDFSDLPDPALGARLHAHLDAGDPAAFATRVLARLGARDGSSWDVLAGWARPGIAAAILLATLLGTALAMNATRNSGDRPAVLAEAMERDLVVGVVLGASR